MFGDNEMLIGLAIALRLFAFFRRKHSEVQLTIDAYVILRIASCCSGK